MKRKLIGIDIGGTKTAIVLGQTASSKLQILKDTRFATNKAEETIRQIISTIWKVLRTHELQAEDISGIGISCGGPLNSKTGFIQSPPNLPGWDNIPIVEKIKNEFNIATGLQNDANACALAEWKFGAGQGTDNMIFLTFGTGLGAGLILNGALYSGTNDNAGEIGHIRLTDFGPVGYGKSGSFEGFCSGGGITQLGQSLLKEKAQMGIIYTWCPPEELNTLTTLKIAEAALQGDELAKEVFRISGTKLGQGLSILIDVLNPELIVMGGIYTRCRTLLESYMLDALGKEALPQARKACRILPSQLGEDIGSYAALSVAANLLND